MSNRHSIIYNISIAHSEEIYNLNTPTFTLAHFVPPSLWCLPSTCDYVGLAVHSVPLISQKSFVVFAFLAIVVSIWLLFWSSTLVFPCRCGLSPNPFYSRWCFDMPLCYYDRLILILKGCITLSRFWLMQLDSDWKDQSLVIWIEGPLAISAMPRIEGNCSSDCEP